jgi:hypothetical protein
MTEPLVPARLGRATLGNSAWCLDQLITFLAIGEDTDGRFSLLRVRGVQGRSRLRPSTPRRTRSATCWRVT